MAEMTIRLVCDPGTGKRNIVISLRSDEDALPHEHEEQHRLLVNKLVEGGVLAASEVGQIIVEREEKQADAAPLPTATAEDQRRAQSQGS
jgi:hypothetical protein